MSLAVDVIVLALAWLGALLVLIAAVGVVRMPDLFSRLQASSKAPALALWCLLIALCLHLGSWSVIARAGVLIAFVFVTAPIAAHLIARAGFATGTELEDATAVDAGVPAAIRSRPPPPADR